MPTVIENLLMEGTQRGRRVAMLRGGGDKCSRRGGLPGPMRIGSSVLHRAAANRILAGAAFAI
ncbi:hypothetical protein WS68_07265 [Burkholderia sp. TSV86]|nr:hypothetical protein WS68_07265 [Burkholderia sp. TSV86]